jgi:hypothetical protein
VARNQPTRGQSTQLDLRPLRDVLAAVVRMREAIGDGEIMYADAIAEGVEVDLLGWIEREESW